MKTIRNLGCAIGVLLSSAPAAGARDVGFATIRVEFTIDDPDARDALGPDLEPVRTRIATDLARTLGTRLRHIRFTARPESGDDLVLAVAVAAEQAHVNPSPLVVRVELKAHPRTQNVPRRWQPPQPLMSIDELVMEGFGESSEFDERIRRAVGLEVDAQQEPTRAALEVQAALFENVLRRVRLMEGANHVEMTRYLHIVKPRDDAGIPSGSIFRMTIAFDDPTVGRDDLTCRARLVEATEILEHPELDPALQRALVARADDDLHGSDRELEHVRRLETMRATATEVFLDELRPPATDLIVPPSAFVPGGVE